MYTVIKSLCSSEANDGVDDSGSIDGCEGIDDGDDDCILLAVITDRGKKKK